jgi:hypothetical protein
MGKNIVTQMNGHFLNFHFLMFERSQRNHNSLDCYKKFGIFFINCKVYMLKVTQIKNVFTCSKHSNLESGQSLFFQMFFFPTCAPFFLKNGEVFNIDD